MHTRRGLARLCGNARLCYGDCPEATLTPTLTPFAGLRKCTPQGSVLRHRFDLMFREAGLAPPTQLIETASLLFVTKMLQQTDFIAVVPTEVARYYATYGMVAMLPMQLSCSMDAFGIITRTDWLLSPAATVLLRALKTSAVSSYGCTLDMKNVS